MVFPLSLILDNLIFWDKLAILIIHHPSIYHLFICLLSFYPPTHLSTYLRTRYPLPAHPSVHPPSTRPLIIYSSSHLSIHPCAHPPISPSSTYPPIRHPLASVHLTSYPSTHPSTYLLTPSSTHHLSNFSCFAHLSFHLHSHPCTCLLSHLPTHSLTPPQLTHSPYFN